MPTPTPEPDDADPRERAAALARGFARFARIGLLPPSALDEAKTIRRFLRRRNASQPVAMPYDGRSLLAANLRRFRAERHLAQEALAAVAGLDRSYMGRVERGEINISIDNICKLASALSVEPSALLARH